MAKLKQSELVLNYLRKHKSITQMDALLELGCMRLASRISDLKKEGVPIEREMIDVEKRDGTTASVAQYSLVTPEQQTLAL